MTRLHRSLRHARFIAASSRPSPARVRQLEAPTVSEAYAAVMAAGDLDHDDHITGHDRELAREQHQSFAVKLHAPDGLWMTLRGTERLAHAADVLGACVQAGFGDSRALPEAALGEPRSKILQGLVDESWDELTRSLEDPREILKTLEAGHLATQERRLYVPASDTGALERMRALAKQCGDRFQVIALPETRDAALWKKLSDEPGILYLPKPYVVPGGVFHEMYGWDSYFIARGALAAGRPQIARDLLENYLYEVERYGKIPNSNRSWHLSRTQPPFLPELALAVYGRTGDVELLRRSIQAAKKELDEVFRSGHRRTPSGLSRYEDDAQGRPPEVKPSLYESYPDDPEFFAHDRATRESGWDMTHRFGSRTHKHEALDLNSLLYAYERSLAAMIRLADGPGSVDAQRYDRDAALRARRMRERFWDSQRGLFFDFDFEKNERSRYESAATFYPLFAGWATKEEAAQVASHVRRFLAPGGIAASSKQSRREVGGQDLQWDWPFGWAPHQIIAIEGLRKYGYGAEANAIAYRWLWMVAKVSGESNGLIKEKYDVQRLSSKVNAEYGNQGAGRGSYLGSRANRTVGFAWTNASVAEILKTLTPSLLAAFDQNVPPDIAAPIPVESDRPVKQSA
jgi:alpha,alpha-trehalase